MKEKTRALVIKEVGKLEYREYDIPEINEYEVLLKVKDVALCTLDRRVYLGTRKRDLPFIGGHEVCGTVVKTGKNVAELKAGDKAIFTSAYCNECDYCRTGRGTLCRHKYGACSTRIEMDEGTYLGGGLCQYLRIPASQLVRIPENVDSRYACLTEPLACCVHSIKKARIKFCETVLIIGFGIMGYFHLHLAKMQGARVIVSETDQERLQKAKENGAYAVINPKKQDLKVFIYSITDNQGADVIFNTIPASSMWKQAIEILAPYGRVIAYSSQDSKESIGVDFGDIHSREIEIIGTINPNIEDNLVAVRLISYGMINMADVIDAVYPFEQGQEAFDKANEPGMYRVIIEYSD